MPASPHGGGGKFQSPSLRGSGRFLQKKPKRARRRVSIPFIAGQWSLRPIQSGSVGEDSAFQSPSLRGSGRFGADRPAPPPERKVSIPFIAGQWSLLWWAAFAHLLIACFNPLHCGAVVASCARLGPAARAPQVSIPFIAGQWSLQFDAGALLNRFRHVSIPFIAGQWSLLPGCGPVKTSSLRVSIPFIAGQWSLRNRICPILGRAVFQSPSLRGSGRFTALSRSGRRSPVAVSIPFIAGQWSLLECPLAERRGARRFQSPSLRGSGRFRVASAGEGRWP